MDTITHAIIGATVGRATSGSSASTESLSIHQRMWLGALAAIFPDTDYLAYPIDPLSFISDWHRSITHSLVLLPLWAMALGTLFALMLGKKSLWLNATLVCAASLLSHILVDAITSWGTQIFSPLSNYRIALGSTYVIDPYFTMLILTGLLLSLHQRSILIARLALIVLVGYVGVQLVLKYEAKSIALISIKHNQWQYQNIYTMPQPYSPFHWKLIVTDESQYHVTHVDLGDMTIESPLKETLARLFTGWDQYHSRRQLHWDHYPRLQDNKTEPKISNAWQDPELSRYKRFAHFPVFNRTITRANETCFEFMDLRYVLPAHSTPFKYALCQEESQNTSRVVQLD